MELDPVLKWRGEEVTVILELIPHIIHSKIIWELGFISKYIQFKIQGNHFFLGIQKYPRGREQTSCLQSI